MSGPDSPELMYIQCCYCREWIDVKPGKMNEITHTICPDCFEKLTAKKHRPAAKPRKKPAKKQAAP